MSFVSTSRSSSRNANPPPALPAAGNGNQTRALLLERIQLVGSVERFERKPGGLNEQLELTAHDVAQGKRRQVAPDTAARRNLVVVVRHRDTLRRAIDRGRLEVQQVHTPRQHLKAMEEELPLLVRAREGNLGIEQVDQQPATRRKV